MNLGEIISDYKKYKEGKKEKIGKSKSSQSRSHSRVPSDIKIEEVNSSKHLSNINENKNDIQNENININNNDINNNDKNNNNKQYILQSSTSVVFNNAQQSMMPKQSINQSIVVGHAITPSGE